MIGCLKSVIEICVWNTSAMLHGAIETLDQCIIRNTKKTLPSHKCIAVSISCCQSGSVSNVFSNNTSKASRQQVTHANCDSG